MKYLNMERNRNGLPFFFIVFKLNNKEKVLNLFKIV